MRMPGKMWRTARRWLRRAWIVTVRLALLIGLLIALGDGSVRDASLGGRVTALAREHLFDYVDWEIGALWDKARQELLGVQPYLDEDESRAQVLDYLDRVAQVQALEAEIEAVYADPDLPDPAAATAELRAERDALRADLDADQGLVEGIIEAQVSAVLADAGFEVLGQVLPPVSMHFSEMPTSLIVSPRDRIEFAVQRDLVPLTVEERATLEAEIDAALDVSSLVVPLGGLSLYPSMILETSRLARAFEVTAHEWAHHYLVFYPLGWEYSARPETRIINETVATFLGREVAREVMARYYPDQPQPVYPSFLDAPDPITSFNSAPLDLSEPIPFDYAREMDRTRRQVDALLAEGRVSAAESYMEARRGVFVRNGYPIRKLNQAYFAFYGGYQGAPGAGGSDPTGPAVEELRALSPGLKAWLTTLRGITTRDALLAAVERARGAR